MKYLKSVKVIHGDIKPRNIFIGEDMQIKIGDFGLSVQHNNCEQLDRNICGTSNYMAPELLVGKRLVSFQSDVWSLGVMIYTLLFGQPPFHAESKSETFSRIKNISFRFPD
jgi:serine/threonine protein kinase